MASLEMRIDWLTVSKLGGQRVTNLSRALYEANYMVGLAGVRHSEYPVAGNPAAHYAYNFKYVDGLWVDVASDLDRQGIRMQMSGRYLLTQNTQSIITEIQKTPDLRATRVDVAFDVKGFGATVRDFAREYEMEHQGRKYATTLIDGVSGSTFYIGSRASDKMLRIYDKAAEQGLEADWVRVEIEIKGDLARAALKALANREYGLFASVVASMYNVTDGLMETVFKNIITPGEIKPDKDVSDGLGWWLKSVIPALSRLKREDTARYVTVISLIKDSGHDLD